MRITTTSTALSGDVLATTDRVMLQQSTMIEGTMLEIQMLQLLNLLTIAIRRGETLHGSLRSNTKASGATIAVQKSTMSQPADVSGIFS